jgi:hypothetical protein
MQRYLTSVQVTGVLLTGHTSGAKDAPVIIDIATALHPGQAALADLRCRSCDAHVTIGGLDGDTLAVVEHERGCAALAAIALRAAVSS